MTKITNVYVSEEALEEHRQKVHRKGKYRGEEKEVMNVMLGFNRKEEDEYEWDKIGKNFEKEFKMLVKKEEIQN